jgi:myosin heavy subunit
LDATVSSSVFKHVSERLRREKAATVFVTNDVNLPRRCDKVILRIDTTAPHYIRCPMPNDMPPPDNFDSKMIIDQLRCGDVLEGGAR